MTMEIRVCLVCLNTFKSCSIDSEDSNEDVNGQVPLLTKFLKFVADHLQISNAGTKRLQSLNSEDVGHCNNQIFCEKCELTHIQPILQHYLDFLRTQLRLSWELEQLGSLLTISRGNCFGSDNSKLVHVKLLAEQLGFDEVSHLEEFRNSLAKKCECFIKACGNNQLLLLLYSFLS